MNKYISAMYELSKDKKNNESAGWKKIATYSKISQPKACEIKDHLKKIGVLTTKGNKTYIQKYDMKAG